MHSAGLCHHPIEICQFEILSQVQKSKKPQYYIIIDATLLGFLLEETNSSIY